VSPSRAGPMWCSRCGEAIVVSSPIRPAGVRDAPCDACGRSGPSPWAAVRPQRAAPHGYPRLPTVTTRSGGRAHTPVKLECPAWPRRPGCGAVGADENAAGRRPGAAQPGYGIHQQALRDRCGRRVLRWTSCSPSALRACAALTIRIRSSSSRQMRPTNRSQIAFDTGTSTGIWITSGRCPHVAGHDAHPSGGRELLPGLP
jgi:hypothetical protein